MALMGRLVALIFGGWTSEPMHIGPCLTQDSPLSPIRFNNYRAVLARITSYLLHELPIKFTTLANKKYNLFSLPIFIMVIWRGVRKLLWVCGCRMFQISICHCYSSKSICKVRAIKSHMTSVEKLNI